MFANQNNTTMSKSKELFIQERQAQADIHLDDDYQYQQWMAKLQESSQSFNNNSAIDVLNDVFKAYGEIFGSNKIENERTDI